MHQFTQLLERLQDHDVRFVLIGGVAASLRGSTQGTFDVDVCIAVDDVNLHRIHAALKGINPRFRMRPDRMPLWEDPARLSGIRNLNLSTDLGQIDLLGEVTGVGDYAAVHAHSSPMDLGGIVIPVIDLETLIVSKRAAGRPKDQLSLLHLEAAKNLPQNKKKS